MSESRELELRSYRFGILKSAERVDVNVLRARGSACRIVSQSQMIQSGTSAGGLALMEITRRFEFDAGHRVKHHKSKCRNLHGHRYVLEVTLKGEIIQTYGDSSQGMVMDFGDIKDLINEHFVEQLDHAFIVWEDDESVLNFLRHDGHKHVVVPFVPTAENLVVYAKENVSALIEEHTGGRVTVSRIRLYETPNSWADA